MATFGCLSLGFLTTIAADVESTLGSHLRVATFNLRDAGTKSPNSWVERRPVMKACWSAIDADIVMFSRRGQFPSDHHPVIADLRW